MKRVNKITTRAVTIRKNKSSYNYNNKCDRRVREHKSVVDCVDRRRRPRIPPHSQCFSRAASHQSCEDPIVSRYRYSPAPTTLLYHTIWQENTSREISSLLGPTVVEDVAAGMGFLSPVRSSRQTTCHIPNRPHPATTQAVIADGIPAGVANTTFLLRYPYSAARHPLLRKLKRKFVHVFELLLRRNLNGSSRLNKHHPPRVRTY